MIRTWLMRWGRSPDEIAQKIQTLGLVRTGRLISRALREPAPEPRVMAPWLESVLAAAMDQLCAYDDELMPSPSECGAVEAANEFSFGMPSSTQIEFQSLLAILEVAPFVFGPHRRRFTELSPRDQDVHLQGWERSTLVPRQGGFAALKSVIMMGYWTRPESFASIGYSVVDNPGVVEPQLSQWKDREGGTS